MKKVILFTCLATLGSAFANNSINVDDCEFSIPYDIDLKNQTVLISEDKTEVFRIDDSNQLYIAGEKQLLDESQLKQVAELGDGYRELVPLIAQLAGEAAKIGLKAAALTLNTLFSDDPTASDELTAKLDEIGNKIQKKSSESHLSSDFTSKDFLDEELEQELEVLIEESVEQASGKKLWNLVWQALSSDEQEQKDLEFRMEMFAGDVEMQVEEQAKALETVANKLCDNMTELDQQEAQLQHSLKAFSNIDVFQKNNR